MMLISNCNVVFGWGSLLHPKMPLNVTSLASMKASPSKPPSPSRLPGHSLRCSEGPGACGFENPGYMGRSQWRRGFSTWKLGGHRPDRAWGKGSSGACRAASDDLPAYLARSYFALVSILSMPSLPFCSDSWPGTETALLMLCNLDARPFLLGFCNSSFPKPRWPDKLRPCGGLATLNWCPVKPSVESASKPPQPQRKAPGCSSQPC